MTKEAVCPGNPRERPRPEHRLQPPVRRHLPRAHRAAPQRRGLPRRPRGRRIPDPTTAGDFCRRFTAGRRRAAHGRLQRGPAAGLEAAARRTSSTRPSSTPTARSPPPTAGASRAWTSPTTAPGATTRWSSRWPTPPSRCSWSTAAATGPRTSTPTSTSTRRSPSAAGRGFRKITVPGRHRLHPDQAPRPLGRRTASGSSSGSTPWPTSRGWPSGLPDLEYSELERPPRYTIKTAPRQARERHKERIVAERQFETLKLVGEEVAEFEYRPSPARRRTGWSCSARSWSVEKGQLWLFEPDRYFFYITNDRTTPAVGDRVPGQRPVRPGEPDRPAQGRREGAGDAGGRPGEQVG